MVIEEGELHRIARLLVTEQLGFILDKLVMDISGSVPLIRIAPSNGCLIKSELVLSYYDVIRCSSLDINARSLHHRVR